MKTVVVGTQTLLISEVVSYPIITEVDEGLIEYEPLDKIVTA